MKEITGMMVYYYFVCKRKLWYFTNNISFENENEDVLIGKYLDENTYNNQDKHININNVINIDYIKNEKIIHEIKKSKKIEYANIMQINTLLRKDKDSVIIFKSRQEKWLEKEMLGLQEDYTSNFL